MNTDHLVRRVMEPAFKDREQDILDQRWSGRITNQEAIKLLAELYDDHKLAQAIVREKEKTNASQPKCR